MCKNLNKLYIQQSFCLDVLKVCKNINEFYAKKKVCLDVFKVCDSCFCSCSLVGELLHLFLDRVHAIGSQMTEEEDVDQPGNIEIIES